MNDKDIKRTEPGQESSITRREALQKMGYAAFASSTMFLLLNNPTKAYAASPNNPGNPGDDDPFGDGGGQNNSWGNQPLEENTKTRREFQGYDPDPWKDDWK